MAEARFLSSQLRAFSWSKGINTEIVEIFFAMIVHTNIVAECQEIPITLRVKGAYYMQTLIRNKVIRYDMGGV